MRRLLTIGLALTLSACSDALGPNGGSTVNLASAKARWLSHGLTDYQITVTQSCFCANIHPLRLTVLSDTVRTATDLVTGQSVDPRLAMGVTQLFDFIANGIAKPAAKLDVGYDAVYGFPYEIDYDLSEQVADDEGAITVRDLQSLQTTARQGTAPAAPARRGSAPAVTLPFSIFTAEP